MKKTIRENKVLFALTIIIIISLVLMTIGLLSYFYGNNKSPYGDRLNGMEGYPINKSLAKDIQELLDGDVTNVKIETKGKIIYIIIDVNKEVGKLEAKDLAAKSLEKFSDNEKNYYDLQFLITCEDEEEEERVFPIEGYKNSTSNSIIWTNN